MTATEQTEMQSLLRDIAFTGLVPPEGSRVRGLFRPSRGYPAFALFVEHDDASQRMYRRDGDRSRWLS